MNLPDLISQLERSSQAGRSTAAGSRPPLLLSELCCPLGPLVAAVDEEAVWLLEFSDRPDLTRQMRSLRAQSGACLKPGQTVVTQHLQEALGCWFADPSSSLPMALRYPGTAFQERVWDILRTIPLGETRSYAEVAAAAGSPTGARAAAQAVARNRIALLIPCHRVIGADGRTGGYAGGPTRKRKLLDWERSFASSGRGNRETPPW